MLEMLAMPLMQRALVAGVLVGILASYYGVFVVQRGLSFMGNGLAHAAFGGVALGLLLGAEPLWVAIPFTVAVGLGIAWVQRRTRLGADTAIGIFFATSMALGMVFLTLREGYAADAFTYLFGSILMLGPTDLWIAGGTAFLTLAALPMWGRWAYATFDRELALADRLRVDRDDYLLAVLLAITVVAAVKVVGIVLIAAFLVIPPATARLLTPTFAMMTWASIAIGTASVLAGMAAAWHFDLPPGPAIILVQAGVFFLAMLVPRRA